MQLMRLDLTMGLCLCLSTMLWMQHSPTCKREAHTQCNSFQQITQVPPGD